MGAVSSGPHQAASGYERRCWRSIEAQRQICSLQMSEHSAGSDGLRQQREAIVREHMESENRLDFDVTIGTFSHPRYELVPTGDVFDGETEVRAYFAESRSAFPDQRNELIAMHHADDAVIVEFDLLGNAPRSPARAAADGALVSLPHDRFLPVRG